MTSLSKNFALEEFCRSQTAARMGRKVEPTDEETLAIQALVRNIFQPLRDVIDKPIIISSGLRPEWLNKAIGGSKTSQHMLGEAGDFNVIGMTPLEVCHKIVELKLPFDQLIHEFKEWVHVSHSLQPVQRGAQLTAYYKDGITQYKLGLE